MTEQEKVQKFLRLKNEAPLALDPVRTALLVIDVQRYFVHPDHPLGQLLEGIVPGLGAGYFERIQRIVLPNIQRLLGCFRESRSPVFYTGIGSCLPDGRDLVRWLREFDELGQKLLGQRVWPPVGHSSWQIDDSVKPRSGEVVLNKTSSGPLSSTRLEQTLHNMGIEALVVTGLTTDVCVTQTARETADRGFQVIVPEDACTTLSEEMHRVALQCFNIAFGRVLTTEQVVRMMTTRVAS